jgi:hypothetical protein
MHRRTLPLIAIFLASVAWPLFAQSGPPPREAYASPCGSEIPWLDDFEAASKKAAAEKKPIFWFVPTGRRTKMDRKQEVYWYAMGGMFADPAMVALIRERFVPLRLGFSRLLPRRRRGQAATDPLCAIASREQGEALAERYELNAFQFIEPGFLILDAKAEKVHVFDRLSFYHRGWMMDRLGKVFAKHRERLGAAAAPIPDFQAPEKLRRGHELLRGGRYLEAHANFQKIVGDAFTKPAERAEALYFMGACLHRLARTEEGNAIWKKIQRRHSGDRWGWKAKLELEGWGPFRRGFEVYRDLPEHALASEEMRTTRTPGEPQAALAQAKRGLDLLLRMQEENGSWSDSRYDFGGLDSVPNVHVAVTAIAAAALLRWRDQMPERVDAAVSRAARFLLDEKNLNYEDKDELVWAQIYRLHFFQRLVAARPKLEARSRAKITEIIAKLEEMPRRRGAWAHEYPNAFVTASVIQALDLARRGGAKVKSTSIKKGAEAIAASRTKEGYIGYSLGTRGASAEFSAGRMPICELALFIAEGPEKRSASLKKAIESSFEKHELLEKVRRYDDHADRYGNGGFFFWYDMHTRAIAIEMSDADETQKAAWRAALLKIVTEIHEADGGWIDSHELGKSYGTAMGLEVLGRVRPVKD